jgi:hypothetical protein
MAGVSVQYDTSAPRINGTITVLNEEIFVSKILFVANEYCRTV